MFSGTGKLFWAVLTMIFSASVLETQLRGIIFVYCMQCSCYSSKVAWSSEPGPKVDPETKDPPESDTYLVKANINYGQSLDLNIGRANHKTSRLGSPNPSILGKVDVKVFYKVLYSAINIF
jgi:hypothetical protein